MDEFLILLQAKLDEAKSKGNVNTDIDKLQSQIDKLKIQAEIDPKVISNLIKQLESVLSQKIVISEIGLNSSNAIKAAQQTGQKIGNAINQGITNTVSKADKTLKSFTELKIGTGNINAILDKNGLLDVEKSLNKIKQIYSEFGQVKITNKIFDPEGNLQQFRVDIQQVNGELKESRNFMMALSSDGKSFSFPQDVIKGSESFVHHLNEAKNISNATGEELNAQKEKLAEQEKYYNRLEQASKEQLAIEKQRITAGEKQLELLDAQSKRRDSRISYNEGQLDKKGLVDTSKQREINNLVYSGKEKFDTSFAKEIDKSLSSLSKLKTKWQEQGIYVDEFRVKVDNLEKSLNEISIGDITGLNAIRQQLSSLSIEAQDLDKINKIQLSIGDKGDVTTQVKTLSDNFTKLGLSADEVKSKMSGVDTELTELKSLLNSGANNSAIITQFNKMQSVLKETQNDLKTTRSEYSLLVTAQQRLNKANTIETWNQKNSAATKQVISANETYIASLRDLNSQMTRMQFNEISDEFKKTENFMRSLGRLGASFKEQMSQAAQSFTQWLSVSSAVMLVISKTRNAISELKEINTLLTEISKANDKLSKSDLDKIGNNSFDIASKYGKNATDYLSGVQEASRAGYENAEGIAELSVAAQGAGDMTAELANQYLIATDKAYKFGGSVEKLTEVLDGSNYITNHNAVNMTELAESMSIVGSTAASFGVDVDETTAALGTMIATTQQSGSEVARAFKAILLNIRQVSDEEEGIDAEGLTKYENACNALNVKLKETKNGVLSLRDPMEVLRDLSIEYNKLEESDIRRTELLSSVGGKLRATQLDALLRQWDTYETMLQQYADGTGSMAVEAEKTANSWEGSMNRLGNTWKDTIENIADSDAIITVINSLNSLLSVVNNVTDKLGSLGTIGLGAGIFAGAKNTGKCRMSVRIS